MGLDLRQVAAAILTVTMFVTLGKMIRRDYIDYVQVNGSEDAHGFQNGRSMVAVRNEIAESGWGSKGPWMGDIDEPTPCWATPTSHEATSSHGHVTFSLTNGPEYHISQISNAVMVAKHLGARLVLPDIRGSKPGDVRDFEDIYDVDKFITSLKGVVEVVKQLPEEISHWNIAIVKVPSRLTKDYIIENIEPVFKSKGNVRIATYFSSFNLRVSSRDGETDPVSCLAMFGTLELQPALKEVAEFMIKRLKSLSPGSNGRFIAIDLNLDILKKKDCDETSVVGSKSCYSAREVAAFLKKIGFNIHTTIYLTQPRWDSSLDIFTDTFPETYTKESIMAESKKSKYLETESSEYEKAIDFYISARSDVFVPAVSGLFYANTVGKRIAMGKPQVLVPAEIHGEASAAASGFLSPYISKRNHLAYSCFC